MSDRQLAKKWFDSHIRDFRTAAKLVIQDAAAVMKKNVISELKARFKSSGDSRGFFKAVRTFDLTKDETRNPAAYVRMGIKFMHVFVEGAVISSRRSANLVIRLPDGAKLGFPRANFKNWKRIYAEHGKNFAIVRKGNGWVVLYKKDGVTYPVYKLQPTVKMPIRLSFFEIAEKVADDIPNKIDRLLDGEI